MADNRRNRQVAGAIRDELVTIIRKDLSNPSLERVGMITFSGVDLTEDFRNATVWVAFMGKQEENREVQEALKALRDSAMFIHRLLIKRIPMKVHPLLSFKFDPGFERAAIVNEALQEAAALEKETAKFREENPEDTEAANKARYRKKKGLSEE
jgi:ribosome-binding factor A